MNILLVCNAGMSTGIMRVRLEEEAKKREIEAEVKAIPMAELDDYKADASVILLGPQIRFALDDIIKSSAGIPVLAISPQDFGMMNASKVFDQVLEVLD